MSIETDIVAWALDRPGWQQEVLVSLANGEVIDDAGVERVIDEVLAGHNSAPSQEAKKISIVSNIPEQVQLAGIRDSHGLNALVDGQELTFAPRGLTVIYGDNGSGKSGYARLLKSVVSARHAASVLPDVFATSPSHPKATIAYSVGGFMRELTYPGSADDLKKVSFYDEHCGDEYLTRQSTISYRPSALALLDGLVDVCDRMRIAVQQRILACESRALQINLPPTTTSGSFLIGLSASTSDAQIEKATTPVSDTTERLAVLLQEEARLQGSNTEAEKARLSAEAEQLHDLCAGLLALIAQLGPTEIEERSQLRKRSLQLRVAATVAAARTFDTEPLSNVGSEAWRTLWRAARDYSLADAYHDHEFPVTDDGSVCVFCQQPLSADAKGRLERFSQFMADTTEVDARASEQALDIAIQELREVVIASPEHLLAISTLKGVDSRLGEAAESLMTSLSTRKEAVIAHLTADEPLPETLIDVDLPQQIKNLASTLQQRADALDSNLFRTNLAAVTARKDELIASVRLREAADAIKQEVMRLRHLRALNAVRSAADTSAITMKSSSLARSYATKQILDQFTRETDRLRLQRVTLEDLGGQKGQLNQRPGLLGANYRDAHARAVLSEGEQTALGLAGFFTEAEFDDSRSALIFDDPVTSLDHVRRSYVSRRLAQLAHDRQVVVFTHDIAFIADLSKEAEQEDVDIAERSVERRGNRPGVCVEKFPWKAKDFKSRVHTLQVELSRLRKDFDQLSSSDYEERVASWAGLLSETWERSVSTEVLDHVFDRGKSEVRVSKFRLLAGITEKDNKDFQDGYGSTSKWARRHDKSALTNYVAPDFTEMESELERLIEWQKRMKSYV